MENVLQKSLRSLLEYSHKKYKNNKFLQFIDGPGYTFGSFYEKVKEVATTLSQYGIKKGDRVGLISQNMPNWGAAYFASTAFGSISVPMLPDFSESEIKHILKHSEAKALFVSKRLFSKIKQKAIDRLSLIISIDDWSILKGEKVENPEPLCSEDDIQSDELAAIIYTSGTTGSSKGVMLSHRNLCANLYAAQELRPSYEWDKWLSILPLSHTLEQSLSLLLPMLGGSQVFYMEKAPTPTMLLKSMQQVKPTTMLSVPLIIEKVYRSAVLPKFTKSKVMKSAYSFPPT
ncbi:MAG: AMP-binding protein, partial [Bacteroidales bacterium]|nr:AMP-binding protein [Bacteroidales bacterium]